MVGSRALVVLGAFWLSCGGGNGPGSDALGDAGDVAQPPVSICEWKDHPANPVIEPPQGAMLIADPTFLSPDSTPDGRWHLFAHDLSGIYHYVSDDGLDWSLVQPEPVVQGLDIRPYLYAEGGAYYLLYEHVDITSHNRIEMRTSADLAKWSDPVVLLEPSLDWENTLIRAVGNPFLTKRDGKYWLYYSAGSVFLEDAGYFEPAYIGVARADDLEGPYMKEPKPLISPDADDPLRNLGAGSMKLLSEKAGGRFVALNNGIYRDYQGHTRSSIRVLASDDGLAWETLCTEPILEPEPGWKEAYVYAFDARLVEGTWYLYYNARDGWTDGVERIGLATVDAYGGIVE